MVPAAAAVDVGPVFDLARFRDQQRDAIGVEGMRILAVDFDGPGEVGGRLRTIRRTLPGRGVTGIACPRAPKLDHPGAHRRNDRDLLREGGRHHALVECRRLVHVARHVNAVDGADNAELHERADGGILVGDPDHGFAQCQRLVRLAPVTLLQQVDEIDTVADAEPGEVDDNVVALGVPCSSNSRRSIGLTTKLPSLAMNWNGTAVQFQDSASLMKRDMQALRMRKRYFRGSTSMNGAYVHVDAQDDRPKSRRS